MNINKIDTSYYSVMTQVQLENTAASVQNDEGASPLTTVDGACPPSTGGECA